MPCGSGPAPNRDSLKCLGGGPHLSHPRRSAWLKNIMRRVNSPGNEGAEYFREVGRTLMSRTGTTVRRRRASRKPRARMAATSGATPPTSYDVAQLAGVSQSAVSRCFRPDASISSSMRSRVLAAARRLGYSPDAIARTLSTRRSGLIGVVISNLTNLYYPEVLSELNAACGRHNVHPLLFTIQTESDVERVLGNIWQYRLDGAIVAARLEKPQVSEFQRRQVPLVFYNRHLFEGASNAVCCDQVGGARLIIDALADGGHRRIGLIAGPKDSVVATERIEACLARMKQLGLKAAATVAGDFSYEGGRKATEQIIRKLESRASAIVASNDMMALGCIDGARYDLGLRVPQDISVVGFDGIEPAKWASYALTTIRQPVRQMATAAVDLLAECITNPSRSPEQRFFSGVLVSGSSAKLRAD
jgi:DNA-binding LacI/PurR family transcriptional regulator